jgi:hypothetical protein
MHRFVWPLRYTAPAALATGGRRRSSGDGVWAPPGRYTAVLEVDGAHFSQALSVVPDPRLTLRPEDYAEQFALARRIEDARARAATAYHEVTEVLKALADRRKGASPELGKALDALQAGVIAISGPPLVNGFAPPMAVTTLGFVVITLEKLNAAVDGADAAPSPDAVAGFDKIQPTLAAGLTAWDAFKAKDLAALNAKLKQAGLPAITPAPELAERGKNL